MSRSTLLCTGLGLVLVAAAALSCEESTDGPAGTGGTPAQGGTSAAGAGGGAQGGAGGTAGSAGGAVAGMGGTAPGEGGTGQGGTPAMGGTGGSATGGTPGSGGSGTGGIPTGGTPGTGGTPATGGVAGGAGGGAPGTGGMATSGGPALPCPPGATLCESFEEPLAAAWGNQIGINSPPRKGNATRESTRAFSGMWSLYSKVPFTGNDSDFGQKVRKLVVPKPDAYLRYFAYLSPGSVPGASHPSSSLYIGLFKSGSGFMALGAGLNKLHLGPDGYGDGKIASTPIDPMEFPTGRWVCLEIKFTQTPQWSLSIWRDGALVVDNAAVVAPTGNSATIDAILVGAYGANLNGLNFEGWFDDVVVSSTPIGCK